MNCVLRLAESDEHFVTGSQGIFGRGSGSIAGTFPEKCVVEDFMLVIRGQLREILIDLFEQYNRTKRDPQADDRTMLIRQIGVITKLYYESSGDSHPRSKKKDPARGSDDTATLPSAEVTAVFKECLERFIGNLTDTVAQIRTLADEDVRSELVERIAESFDESFAQFTRFTGDRDE